MCFDSNPTSIPLFVINCNCDHEHEICTETKFFFTSSLKFLAKCSSDKHRDELISTSRTYLS